MTANERTRQQLDPIGTFGNGLTTLILALGSFAIAVVITLQDLDQIMDPSLAILALLLIGFSCAVLIFASNPFRAPFSRRSHALVVVGGLLAIAIYSVSAWSNPGLVRNDWGPVSIGLLFLAMGPYRPARELVASGTISAILVGFLTVLHVRSVESGLPALATVAVTIMPILALAYASAAYGNGVVTGLEQWHRKLMRPGRVVSREDEDGIARSVQQDRVTILNREVLPFFLDIIEKPAVSNGDRSRARDIANSIRRVMVAEVDRSWLEQALDQIDAVERPSEVAGSAEQALRDDDHIANVMTYDQRTALRAFLVALHELPGHAPDFLRIELFRDGQLCRGVMVVTLKIADYSLRSRFAPYFAVLRVMFADLRLEYLQGVLTLSFSYEQR